MCGAGEENPKRYLKVGELSAAARRLQVVSWLFQESERPGFGAVMEE